MKKLIILFLFLSTNITAQELTGTWNVTSYEDEIVYYNQTTDSIYYKDESRKAEAENFRKMFEMMILPVTYTFKDNNEYEMLHPMLAEIKGTYEIDRDNNYVILSEKNTMNDTLPFSMSNEILYLRMKLEEGFMKIGLKKKFLFKKKGFKCIQEDYY